jgi:hypothetical protein
MFSNPIAAPSLSMDSFLSFLLLDWVDKSTASLLLIFGEVLLLIFSLAVAIGVAGESWADKKKESWIPAPHSIARWHRIFAFCVFIGVAGELIADGEIFSSSHRLQSIQEDELAKFGTETAEANTKAKTAIERATEIMEATAWRQLTKEQNAAILKTLTKERGNIILSWIENDPESLYLSMQIYKLLQTARWNVYLYGRTYGSRIYWDLVSPAGGDSNWLANLRQGLIDAKVTFTTDELPSPESGVLMRREPPGPNAITLMIGSRRPSFSQPPK